MKNPVYVVRTHKFDEDTVAMVHELGRDIGEENVSVVYNDSRVPLPGMGRPALDTVLHKREPIVALTYNSAAAVQFNRYHVSAWHNGHEPYMFLEGIAVRL